MSQGFVRCVLTRPSSLLYLSPLPHHHHPPITIPHHLPPLIYVVCPRALCGVFWRASPSPSPSSPLTIHHHLPPLLLLLPCPRALCGVCWRAEGRWRAPWPSIAASMTKSTRWCGRLTPLAQHISSPHLPPTLICPSHGRLPPHL